VLRAPLLSTHSIYNRAGGELGGLVRGGRRQFAQGQPLQHFSHMLLALEAAR